MKVYVLMNADGAFICKKGGNVYISDKDLDKINTYRNKNQAENIVNDKEYWNHRNININSFVITPIKLEFTRLDEVI